MKILVFNSRFYFYEIAHPILPVAAYSAATAIQPARKGREDQGLSPQLAGDGGPAEENPAMPTA
jgi:hypothetical protein